MNVNFKNTTVEDILSELRNVDEDLDEKFDFLLQEKKKKYKDAFRKRTEKQKEDDIFYGELIIESWIQYLTGLERCKNKYEDFEVYDKNISIDDIQLSGIVEIKTISRMPDHFDWFVISAISNYLNKKNNKASFMIFWYVNRETHECKPYRIYKRTGLFDFEIVKQY